MVMSDSLKTLPVVSKTPNQNTAHILDRFFPNLEEPIVQPSKYNINWKRLVILTIVFAILASSMCASASCFIPMGSFGIVNLLYRSLAFMITSGIVIHFT